MNSQVTIRSCLYFSVVIAATFAMGNAPAFAQYPAAQQSASQQASEKQEEEPQLTVFSLRNAEAGEVESVLQRLVLGNGRNSSGVNLTSDPKTNSIIVRGKRSEIEAIQALLQSLDGETPDASEAVTAKNVQVEVFWIADLQESDEASYGGELSDIPAELMEGVVSRLAPRLAFENPRLVTKMMVTSVVELGDSHRISPSPVNAESVGRSSEKQLLLSAAGTISAVGSEQYKMSLQLRVGTDKSKSDLEASFLIKPGKPMCLAVAETGPLNSLFVVRVQDSTDQ